MASLSLTDAAAIESIADTRVLLSEARVQLPLLRAAARKPATRDDLARIIGSRFPIYPQPNYDRTELDAFWQSYVDALEGLSAESIEAGMKAWVAKPDSQFLPKPGELRAIASLSITRTGRAVAIIARAVERANAAEIAARNGRREDFHLEAVRTKHIQKPPEDRDAVRQAAADYLETTRQRIAAQRLADRPPMRDTSGPLAEGHHVTAELLAIAKRQREDYDRRHPAQPEDRREFDQPSEII